MRPGSHAACRHLVVQCRRAGDYFWPGLGVGFFFLRSTKSEDAEFMTMVVPGRGGVGRGEGLGLGELPALSSSASWSAREGPLGVLSCCLLGWIVNVTPDPAREGVGVELPGAGRGASVDEEAGTRGGVDTMVSGEGTRAGEGRVLARYPLKSAPRVFPEKVSGPYMGTNGCSCANTVPAGGCALNAIAGGMCSAKRPRACLSVSGLSARLSAP